MSEDKIFFRIAGIVRGTTVDGPGLRTSIYLSGCSHQCPGCHNPETHDPLYGQEMSLAQLMDIVEEEDFNVTLSGGDPLFYPEKLKILIHALKRHGRNVWVYTGYTWEEILNDAQLFDATKEADTIVEGRFIESLKDPDLRFRGSSNQRIIHIDKRNPKASLPFEFV